ncbi:alpha/beta hydrolase [Aliikangiella sp. IMCC44359]|uniref:alpha/beta hydrolase n=1 Tax=Aliikangiella sp. IMCC44359 TaxID=3459125 RepID=UPI00403AB1BD
MALICFSHGKESGPNATKIVALREVARRAGHEGVSVDYRGIESVESRISKLLSVLENNKTTTILVGSSMGAYVSLLAANQVKPKGLFLLAPAVYLPGYDNISAPPENCLTQVFHGWHDDIVPVENCIKYAQKYALELTLLDDDHRLQNSIQLLEKNFFQFIQRITSAQER